MLTSGIPATGIRIFLILKFLNFRQKKALIPFDIRAFLLWRFLAYRLQMYIVTSKPKRISEYSGLVHIIILPIVCYKKLVGLSANVGSHYTQTILRWLEEKSRRNSGFSLAPFYASSKPLLIANRASSAELLTSNFCLILV